MLTVKNVSYGYKRKRKETKKIILDKINVNFEYGKMYAILGKSGSGKSTLLSLLGALEEPDEGSIELDGTNIKEIGYVPYRNSKVSIIFQEYNLLPYYNAIENVNEILRIQKKKIPEGLAEELLESLGITGEEQTRLIGELSGGERQRVAIARSLVSGADIFLADEPTGNLDLETGEKIVTILQSIAHEKKKIVVMVTHDDRLADWADEKYKIETGKMIRL